MPIEVHITDPKSGTPARVSEFGQVVTSPIAYSIPSTGTLTSITEAVNFIEPSGGQKIVITDIILSSDKNIGVDGAEVQVYSADSITSTAAVENGGVLDINMLKNTNRDLIGLNFIVREGLWINAKTDDNNIKVAIGFYRVPI